MTGSSLASVLCLILLSSLAATGASAARADAPAKGLRPAGLHYRSGHRDASPGSGSPRAGSRAERSQGVTGPHSAPTVTLTQALELAVQSSPRLHAARIEPAVARAQLLQIGVRPNPVLAFQYRRLLDEGRPQNRIGADISAPLDLTGRRGLLQEQAALDVRSAEVRVDAAVLAMSTEVRAQFLQLLYLQRMAQLRAERVALGEQLLRAARIRQDLGDIGRGAAALSALAAEQGRADLLQMEGELNQAQTTLDGLVGGDLPDRFVAAGELAAPRTGCDRDVLVSMIQRRRPDTQLLAIALDRAAVGVRLSRAGRMPPMDVGVTIDVRQPGGTLVGGLVTVPLPMFDRGHAATAVALQEADLARQRHATGAMSAAQEVDALCGQIRTAERVLAHVEADVLPLATERRTQLTTEFELGQIPLEDTLRAAQHLLEVQEQALELVYGHAAARLALDAAIGSMAP